MNSRPILSLALSLSFGFSQITPPFAVVVTFDGNNTLSLPAGRDPDGVACVIRRIWIILIFVAE